MKKNIKRAFLLLVCVILGRSASAQDVALTTCEYWLDGRFDLRQSMNMSGSWEQTLDVSALRPGIHSLGVRTADSQGRWSAPAMRYFLVQDYTFSNNALDQYEYWLDGNRENVTYGTLKENQTLEIALSGMRAGTHTLCMRIMDKRGLSGQTFFHYFLYLGEDVQKRELTAYRYWIDDESNVQTGETVDGSIMLDIDVEALKRDVLHYIAYQVADNTGRWSAPQLQYFVRSTFEDPNIAGYGYWFNRGPRTRIAMEPQQTAELKDLWVDIKNVIPNSIPADYRFLVDKEKVEVDDNVYFGIQAFDNAGHPSGAVLSDTFQMVVPVDPHFLSLQNGEVTPFTAPDAGQMQGFKVGSQVNDSLYFTLSDGETQLDFYDATGKRLEVTTSQPLEGQTLYALQASSNTTYVLAYNASAAIDKMNILVENKNGDGLEQTLSDGISIAARGGQLLVTTPLPTDINVVSAAGLLVKRCKTQAGLNSYPLPAGIYVVQLGNGATRKLVVK